LLSLTLRSPGFTLICLTGHILYISVAVLERHRTGLWNASGLGAGLQDVHRMRKTSTAFSRTTMSIIMHLQTIHRHIWLSLDTMHQLWHRGYRTVYCLRDISDFCDSRRLQLNENKTEVMWFGSSASLRGLTATEQTVVIRNANVQPVDSVRNLGVHLDSLPDMHVHIAKTVQVCVFQLRRLRRVRRLLGHDVTSSCRRAGVLPA